MTDQPSDPDEENLRRFLEEVFGGQLPPEALEGMDLSALAAQANLPTDPNQLRAAAAQMQHMFDTDGEGPVNWTLGEDLARKTAAGAANLPGAPEPTGSPGDPTPGEADVRALREAAHVAGLWLDPVIGFDMPSRPLEVWSRGTWVHRTLPRWRSAVEPVAKYMAGAIGDALAAQLEESPMPIPGDPRQMMERMGGTMFGVQFGHAIGTLAREVCGATDLSLPLGPDGTPALVASNVEDLLREHELDVPAGRLFLAARELAHTALFTAVPWLGRQLFSAIEDYARGITLDLDALDEMVRGLDLSDPEAMSRVSGEQMFVFSRRESQERALEELATTLALVEAWVDHVVSTALEGKLPQLEAMREVLRRRRASGSPAEQMLAEVVGIELRPRRVREARSWWESVTATEGIAGRERIWDHPDLLPGADVLDGTPRAPQTPAPEVGGASDEGEDRERHTPVADADMSLPENFDDELEKLLSGHGSGGAPREDTQGRILEDDDSEHDGDDDTDGEDPDGPEQDRDR